MSSVYVLRKKIMKSTTQLIPRRLYFLFICLLICTSASFSFFLLFLLIHLLSTYLLFLFSSYHSASFSSSVLLILLFLFFFFSLLSRGKCVVRFPVSDDTGGLTCEADVIDGPHTFLGMLPKTQEEIDEEDGNYKKKDEKKW